MTENMNKGIERRSVLKGAAWSVPALAAAVAVPAASATTPTCPTCLKPATLLGGAWTSQAIVAGNRGRIALVNVFGISGLDCGITWTNIFQPAYTYLITSATLEMSDGNTYASDAGLGAGVGNISTIGAFPGIFSFPDVLLPNGGAIGGLGNYPTVPSRLTVSINVTLQWGLGAHILCPITLSWGLAGVATGLVANVPFGPNGVGTVNFTGVASAAL